MKVNARTTRPIVTAGSITRRSGFFILLRSIPSRNGMTARLATPGDEPPDIEQDHHRRPEQRHRPVFHRVPSSRIMRNGTETGTRPG